MKDIVKRLREKNKTISTMESCTGGYLASEITNITNSGDVFKFGAVTYSNNYKIKMGVDKKIIDKYTVYSSEVAKEMSRVISNFTNTDYGVGITGKLNRYDKNNPYGDDSTVYIAVYDRNKNEYYERQEKVTGATRRRSKKQIINVVVDLLKTII